MAEFKIDGRMTVRTLKENFKNTFEGTLRVYDGREKADDSATLASIRKNDVKTGEYVCRGSRTVGKFIKEMEEVFGISVKVASPDDWVLALDGITLANLKNIKNNSTKADMEELVAYKRKGEEMDEDYDNDYDEDSDDENGKFEIKDGVCIIPEGTTEIGDKAFDGCEELTSIVIPDSVTKIGESAFSWCTKLTSIVIPASVNEIGKCAFRLCIGLTNVEIYSSEIEFGRHVFSECNHLKSIKVPANTADYFKEILPEELHDLIVEMGESDGNQAKTTKKSYPVFDFALKKIDWELTEDNIEKYREEIDNYGVVVVRALNEDEDFETKVICNGDVADLLYDAMESVEDFENDDWPEVNVYYSTLCEVYGTKEKVWECGEYIFRVLGAFLGDDGYYWGAETGYELLCRVKWVDDGGVDVWKTDKRGDYKDYVDEDMVEEMLEKHSEKSND